MNGFDFSTATEMYIGNTPVSEVYMGSNLIWSSTPIDYESMPLTIQSLSDNNTIKVYYYTNDINSFNPEIQYSIDDGTTWNTVAYSGTNGAHNITTLNTGGKVMLRGGAGLINSGATYVQNNKRIYISNSGKHKIYGNPLSLIKDITVANWYNENISTINTFRQLFYNNTGLTNANNLKLTSTTLVDDCYLSMFNGCTSLKTAPELPATTLAQSCYDSMFNNCFNLAAAPELPATTLANRCYYSMFSGCSILRVAPQLPATTLATNCYQGMFSNTALTAAPELPATTLTQGCYYNMFNGCNALTVAPVLPATTLAAGCYLGMFNGCKSLTTAPQLPATTLATNCYSNMFQGCISLTSAPELPATTLADSCYQSMFNGCNHLVNAPQLPVTTLANRCYYSMFSGCLALTTAPQ